MRHAKNTLKVLFGLSHLAFFFVCQLDGFIDDAGTIMGYLPLGTTLYLSLIVGAFVIPFIYVFGLLLSTVIPALSCFTVGRVKILYAIFVIIPHIINAHISIVMAENNPVGALLSVVYLAIAVLIAVLPG